MRINNITRNPKKVHREDEEISNINSRSTNFEKQLKGIQRNIDRESLAKDLNEIENAGELLKKTGTLKDFITYKKKLKSFLEKAVSLSLKYQEDSHWYPTGHHKILGIIKTVDRELKELADEVLKGQRDNINIMAIVDSIKGLIIDIQI